MQLLSSVYLVGGRHFYWTKARVADCNVYAVRTGAGIVLVDCGYDNESLEAIFRNLRYWGMDPKDIRYVLLTHAHFDHAGNAKALSDLGARIVAHRATADALASADERTVDYACLRHDFPACHVDIAFKTEKRLHVGEWVFDAIPVPGHTDGCVVYQTAHEGKRIMFTGDFVFHERSEEETLGHRGVLQFNSDRYLESLISIRRRRVDVLLPAHHGFLLEKGSVIVDNALFVALARWGNKFDARKILSNKPSHVA